MLVMEAKLTMFAFFDFLRRGIQCLQPKKILVRFVLIILNEYFIKII